jgi:hypothetical protein
MSSVLLIIATDATSLTQFSAVADYAASQIELNVYNP